jgi:tetratricopeptide (TPR) repeat protein
MNAGTAVGDEPVLAALEAWDECYRRGEDPAVESLGICDGRLLGELRSRIEQLKRLYAALRDSGAGADAGAKVNANVGAGDGALPSFPGYEVLSQIGEGGMGVVYKARDVRLDRVVAIKTLAAGRRPAPGQLDRFRVEAAAVARLKHPNVIAIYSIGEHDGRPFYSFEYAEGGSLAERLSDGPLSSAVAASLIETVSDAVHAAHLAGIIHRDLKPSNVLLTVAGLPKIGDFGVAKLMDSDAGNTLTGETLGTPSFMAPEQAEGRSRSVGPASDVYALGAILYQALTGNPPFLGESAMETLKLVVSADVVPPRRLRTDVPRDLETICLKCLEKSPAKRYATARELAQDLRHFHRGEPIRGRRTGPVGRLSKWARRRPWQTALLATVMLGTGAFFTLAYRYNARLLDENRRTEVKAEEARRNYLEARSTIQAMLRHLSDDRFAGSAGMIDLRRLQGDEALSFYDQVLRQVDSSDPEVVADTIRALAEAAQMQYVLGRYDRAEQTIRRALELVETLRRLPGEKSKLLRLQVECLLKLSGYAGSAGLPEESRLILARLIPLAEEMRRAEGDTAATIDLLAACYHTYAVALQGKQNDLAKKHLLKAIALRERPDFLAIPHMRYRVCESVVNLGVIQWQENAYEDAERSFRRGEELLNMPGRSSVEGGRAPLMDSGHLNVNWAGVLFDMRKFDEAVARATQGIESLIIYMRSEPNDGLARDLCLKLHGSRARALAAQGKHKESAVDWARVVELSNGPVPVNYRCLLALELVQAGDLERGVAEAERAGGGVALSAVDLYNLACVFSRAAGAVKSGAHAGREAEARRGEAYASKAIAALRKAAGAGLFQDPAMRDDAQKDSDLESVRDRPEFREIIATPKGDRSSFRERAGSQRGTVERASLVDCGLLARSGSDTIGFRRTASGHRASGIDQRRSS